mgnify:CR=1 FL=1
MIRVLYPEPSSFSDTKIITPTKTYDPDNEFDEEYFEFGLFMSRREYKTIKRRLNAGRISSVKEGKYCGSRPPYDTNVSNCVAKKVLLSSRFRSRPKLLK